MPVRVESFWSPDPIVVMEEMNTTADTLMDFSQPLHAAREIVVRDIREHFEKEEDPSHKAWEEWAFSYKERAEKENVGILQKQSQYHKASFGPQLIDAATNRLSYHVGNHEMFADTSGWPAYWEWHQEGREGRVHAAGAALERQLASIGEGTFGEGTSDLPARPFLGVSEEAEFAIIDILDEFVDGAFTVVTHPVTGFSQRRIGGRFGPGF